MIVIHSRSANLLFLYTYGISYHIAIPHFLQKNLSLFKIYSPPLSDQRTFIELLDLLCTDRNHT